MNKILCRWVGYFMTSGQLRILIIFNTSTICKTTTTDRPAPQTSA